MLRFRAGMGSSLDGIQHKGHKEEQDTARTHAGRRSRHSLDASLLQLFDQVISFAAQLP